MHHLMKLTDLFFHLVVYFLITHCQIDTKFNINFIPIVFVDLRNQFLHKSYNGDIRNLSKQCG